MFLVVWALIVLLVVIDVVATQDIAEVGRSEALMASFFVAALKGLLPAVLLTLLLMLVNLRRSSDHPTVLRLLFLTLSVILVSGGFALLGDVAGRSEAVPDMTGYEIADDTLYRFAAETVYVSEVEGRNLRGVAVVYRDPQREARVVDRGSHLVDSERIRVEGLERQLPLDEAHGGAWRGPEVSLAFRNMLSDLDGFGDELRDLEATSGAFVLRAAALLFFVTAAWVLVRLTRWPVFNVVLFLCVIRGALMIPRVVETELVTAVSRSVLGQDTIYLAPYLLLLVGGGLLLVVNALLPGLSHWERETLDA